MLSFIGAASLTAFRKQQLLSRLQQHCPQLHQITAHRLYLLDVDPSLNAVDLARLTRWLPQAQLVSLSTLSATAPHTSCFVVPRLGTVSPWSSKAMDMAAACGFNFLHRIEQGTHYQLYGLTEAAPDVLFNQLYDPMTESLLKQAADLSSIFNIHPPHSWTAVDLLGGGKAALFAAHHRFGLALSEEEMDYLLSFYCQLGRNPSDVELMMFAQVNSEHCRHHLFNAHWHIDGTDKEKTLFSMIRHTHQQHPDSALVAYSDNAAVLKGTEIHCFSPDPDTQVYRTDKTLMHIVFKVETHNHPTRISPYPGAATGSGGEIRDEAATGRGAHSKMGVTGFAVSHFQIPGCAPQAWEQALGYPTQQASALKIMLEAPIGAASFNNEFGRPNLGGYFRTFLMKMTADEGGGAAKEIAYRGYHKPIMLAGGLGHIRDTAVQKQDLPDGTCLLVLGGPAMPIGLGGGAASSTVSAHKTGEQAALDFASVQRANPEMQRRCQEVINICAAMGADNPILSLHDVGAGGLSNALPELVQACGAGAAIQLRQIPNAAPEMTPLALWCNEAQERYVLAVLEKDWQQFTAIAQRERCPVAVVGKVLQQEQPALRVEDAHFKNAPVDVPMSFLFPDLPAPRHPAKTAHPLPLGDGFSTQTLDLATAIKQVLQFPSVASKQFLITIGDRSVGGLVARDPMVGRWQVPVADVAITAADYVGYAGEALAIGERAPIALLSHAASARMAVGEAITNIAAADITDIKHIALSANWMAAADSPGEAAGLYEAVQAIGMELCPALGISIPVGKDSLSMRTTWEEQGRTYSVAAPLSLLITAAAPVQDVRRTLTPELRTDVKETVLFLIDLGEGKDTLGASVLAQTQGLLGQCPPDVNNPAALKAFFHLIQHLNAEGVLLAYHDRSDGGLLACVVEMMFAAHVGVDLRVPDSIQDPLSVLFNEALGAVIQLHSRDVATVRAAAAQAGLLDNLHAIGCLNAKDELRIQWRDQLLYAESRIVLQQWWAEPSYRLQALRDHPECAAQEFEQIAEANDPGLTPQLTFDLDKNIAAPYLSLDTRPKVAILREQGINGHLEMAAAFERAGFTSVDVTMSDLLNGRWGKRGHQLHNFIGLAACGGFSFGDVLAAGRGWAQSILMHEELRDTFSNFFERTDTFAVGVCNGCQMFSQLKTLIPGAEAWPHFQRNQSEQFEARLSLLRIEHSPSLFLKGMEGSVLPISVAHGEGRAAFADDPTVPPPPSAQVALRYVDHHHHITERYPANPSGSVQGITGLTTADGRVTIMMPHPERVFRSIQLSSYPQDWGEESPWSRFFANARHFVG